MSLNRIFVVCLFATLTFATYADAKLFGNRRGGGEGGNCANGQCGPENNAVQRTYVETSSEGSSGGSYTSTRSRTKLFGRNRNGGSAGGRSEGSSGGRSEGSAGGSYTRITRTYGSAGGGYNAVAAYDSAKNSCQCTCPNCGTNFECSCSGVTSMKNDCNCCEKCTGQPGCQCGCANCTCNSTFKRNTPKTTGMPPVEK